MAKLSKTQTKERIGLLRKELEKHNYNYYVLNSPTISDFEFDLLMQELQALEKLYPEFASKDSPAVKVGSDITSSPTEFVQTAHKYPMLSLGNTTYLLAGEKAGPEKLRKAEKLGVKIISEEEFNALV